MRVRCARGDAGLSIWAGAAAIIVFQASATLAGGDTGPGLIQHASTTVSSALNWLAERNRKGLEYALDPNSDFSRSLKDEIAKSVIAASGANVSIDAGAVTKAVADLVFSTKEKLEILQYEKQNGFDPVVALRAFSNIVEPAVDAYLDAQAPGSSVILDMTKLGFQFEAAYQVGFWSRP